MFEANFRGLRGPQGLAAIAARGLRCTARCTVARLMRGHGPRERHHPRQADPHHGERQGGFHALSITLIASSMPRLSRTCYGVSDFTYVATWTGFVYVAFVHRHLCPAGSSAGG